MIIVRPATAADLLEFYGRMPPVTVKAVVAVKDGKIECVAGVTLEKDMTIAFSDMKAEGANKFEIFRTAKKMANWMKNLHPMVIDVPENRASIKLLEMVGFVKLKQENEMTVYGL